MEKLKTCKTKAKQLICKPLPKIDYEDRDMYLKYLRLQDIRKSIPLGTGVISGTFALATIFSGLGGWPMPFAVYGCLTSLTLSVGVGAYLSLYFNELTLKYALLKESQEK